MNVKHGKWHIALSSLVSLRWKKGIPKLVFHEKFEPWIKWILRFLTIVGIASSVVAFPNWYSSLLFSIIFFVVEQFIERSVFQYTTMYVQPLPDFNYDPAQWKGMAFAFPIDADPKMLNVVGCAFASKDYALSFFRLLKAWNYNLHEDKDDNICLSFIVENKTEYSTYLYPNMDRPSVRDFFNRASKSLKYEKYGKEHQQLVIQMTFCHLFPFGPKALLNTFVKSQKPERPFWLKPFIMEADGRLQMLHDAGQILKWHFTFKRRDQLTDRDYEYVHGKTVMKK